MAAQVSASSKMSSASPPLVGDTQDDSKNVPSSSLEARAMDVFFQWSGVVYKKDSVEDVDNYGSSTESFAWNPFFLAWKSGFERLKLKLVPNENYEGRTDRIETPRNCINFDSGYYSTNYDSCYNGPFHIVFDVDKDNERKLEGAHNYFAVLDSQDPQRAFVGECVHRSFDDFSVIGGICYFSDNGEMDGQLTAFSKVPFSRGHRDSPPTWADTFLCGDNLLRIRDHGWGQGVSLQGWLMDEDSLLFRYDNLRSWFGDKKLDYPDWDTKLLRGRWLCTNRGEGRGYPGPRHCIDLKSIRRQQSVDDRDDNNRDGADRVEFDSLVVPEATGDPEDILRTLEALGDIPSHEATERNGYPTRCIRCGQPTVTGDMKIEGGSMGGLGSGVCQHCMIRYSKSDKTWMCCGFVMGSSYSGEPRLTFCYSKVGPPSYTCTAKHAGADSIMVNIQKRKRKRNEKQDCISIRAKLKTAGEN